MPPDRNKARDAYKIIKGSNITGFFVTILDYEIELIKEKLVGASIDNFNGLQGEAKILKQIKNTLLNNQTRGTEGERTVVESE